MMMLASLVFSANAAMRQQKQLASGSIVITTSIPETFYADSFYLMPLTATYTGSGTLAWTVLKKPSNMQDISDTLTWLPTMSNIGNDTIIISASDGSESDTLKKPITVKVKPTLAITTYIPDTFYVDSLYTIHLTAQYSGGSKLVWTVLRKPSKMQVISNTLMWLPAASNIGVDTIIVSVSDGSESDTLKKTIVVQSKGGTAEKLNRNPEPEIFNVRITQRNESTELLVGIPLADNPGCEINIFDMSGKAVYRKLYSGGGYYQISLTATQIGRGFYLVKVSNGSKVLVRRAFFM
jgi:hypothetical protein